MELFKELKPILDKDVALVTALVMLSWDKSTCAPEEAITNTTTVVGILSEEQFRNIINPKVKGLLEGLERKEEYKKLTETEQCIVKELRKVYDRIETIPPEEYKEYSELQAVAYGIWENAKEHKDFSEFAPCLKKLIEFQKKFANYRKKDNENTYDILLSDFEEGFTMEKLDSFFHIIKSEIVPLLRQIAAKKDLINKDYNSRHFDTQKQKEFSRWVAEYVGLDFKKAVMAESAHPFTTHLHNKDVRITNQYFDDNLESGIFSVIHEAGHAIYEMNVGDQLTQTLAGGGASLGIHESQSRFYENIIGKTREFWQPIYPKLQGIFQEQLKDISLGEFIQGINKVEPGFIRTEADELTYTLHVIIRYEIEKLFITGEVKVEDLPEIWNDKYKEYLGITPKNDAEGILQDVHWSMGEFGYFPTYAIGSAVAAQLYYHMLKVMPFKDYLLEGNIAAITKYLNENIHKYGKMKNTDQLLKDITGETLNPDYYIRYLKEKYTKIYQL